MRRKCDKLRPILQATQVPLRGKAYVPPKRDVVLVTHRCAQPLKIPAQLGGYCRVRVAEGMSVNAKANALLDPVHYRLHPPASIWPATVVDQKVGIGHLGAVPGHVALDF